jgi:hypothetical protein
MLLGKITLNDMLKARIRHLEEERRRERVLPVEKLVALSWLRRRLRPTSKESSLTHTMAHVESERDEVLPPRSMDEVRDLTYADARQPAARQQSTASVARFGLVGGLSIDRPRAYRASRRHDDTRASRDPGQYSRQQGAIIVMNDIGNCKKPSPRHRILPPQSGDGRRSPQRDKRTALGVALLTALSFGANACGGENTGISESAGKAPAAATGTPDPTPQTTETRKPLAVLDTTVTRIEVFEDMPGDLTVAEEGKIGTAPLLSGLAKNFTLAQLYETVASKLKKPLSADVLQTLADADLRAHALSQLQAVPTGTDAPPPPVVSNGASAPNYFDYNSDVSWFHGNFCKPGQYCPVWVYWGHSGRQTNISNWQCTVLNAADTGTATLTLWRLTCSGIFCTTNWTRTHVDGVAARTYRAYFNTSSNAQGVECMGDGVNGTFVAVGLKSDAYSPPAPRPPAPSCGPYIYRAQTTGCTNGTDGSSNGRRLCADGCGTTAQAAQDAAALSISTQTCLGGSPGCCNVTYDQNFNFCGY